MEISPCTNFQEEGAIDQNFLNFEIEKPEFCQKTLLNFVTPENEGVKLDSHRKSSESES